MSEDTTLVVTDRHGVRKAELSKATLDSLEHVLCEPGGGSVSVNPLHPEAGEIELNKVEIQVWIDEEYDHCIVPRAVTGNSKKVTFQCEGILSYFDYRHINDSLDFGDEDGPIYMEQFQIAWNLLTYAQTGANRDRRIESSAWAPSGVGRLRRYNWYDHKNILAELKEFTKAKNGFEYDIVLFPDGRREWTPYYPKKGMYRPELTLEWGRNVTDFTFNKNGTDQGTKTYVAGGSEGDVRFEQNYEDAALSAEYGQMERIVANGSEKDLAWLLDRAQEETEAFGRPVQVPDLVVKDIPADANQPGVKLTGVLKTGDVVPVNVQVGNVVDMVGDYRITRIARLKAGRLRLSFNQDRAA